VSRFAELNNRQLNRFIWILGLIVLGFVVKYRFIGETGDEYKRVINGDGKGYYAYLPAVFIYHDLTFSFFDKDPEKFGYQYSNTFLLNHNEKNLNKYTCGEAILLVPFFLLAMLYSWLAGLPVDGYSGAFHIFCALGTFFYFLAGLFVSKKLLQGYTLSNLAIALALAAISLGTNMLNYIANESSMSHIFSFFTIALHAYTARRFFEAPALRPVLLGGLTLGLIILIRPINGMVVFAYPFLAGERNFLAVVQKQFAYFLLAGLAACAVLFLQLLIWKISIGDFLVYGYKNEGFYFRQPPPLYDYLFSFKRGAFIYSPVLFLSLFGFWKMRGRATEMLWLLFFLLLVVYVHASWWSWYYGDGMGERPLIDFYVFFGLLLAFAFEKISGKGVRRAMGGAFIATLALFQVFFYQYVTGIIHPYSMDYEKFRYVFLKTAPAYRNLFKCETEEFYHPRGVLVSDSLYYSLTDTAEWVPRRLIVSKKNIRQGAHFELNDDYTLVYEVFTDSSWLFKARYAEIAFEYLQPEPDSAASNTLLYVTMSGENKNGYYNANPLEGRVFNTTGEWRRGFERLKIGIPEQTGIMIHVFIDNPAKKRLFIKNLSIKIVEAKP
jgi:hypothetical protein